MEIGLRKFDPDNVPEPKLKLNIEALAAKYSALDLEIGAGAGYRALQYAKAHPDRLLVAIERTREKFQKMQSRLCGHPDLNNLLIIHDEAVNVVTHQFLKESVSRVFIMYPNPYPKESQKNKRWAHMPFVQKLHEVMATGAQIHFATNEEFYATELEEFFPLSGFKLIQKKAYTKSDIGSKNLPNPRTHFEKKYLERGERIYDLFFRKVT